MSNRILILANNSGGLYSFRRELLIELCKKYEVFISVPNNGWFEEMEALGCKIYETPIDRRGVNPVKDFKLLNRYIGLLKELKPNVVLTYTIKPNVYGGIACQLMKIPYIATITGLGTAVETPGALQKVAMLMYKCGLRKAQKVFFQNAENQAFMVKNCVVKGNYDLVPGSGVNLDRYKSFAFPDGETVDFVFVGRIMKMKGIEQYIEAAEYIRKRYPDTRFHICGSLEEDYKERISDLENRGIVIYHGSVRDMTEIYKIISCTVHPTYYPEGLSNVLLESAASGRAIITTDRAGCREVVDDGVNGYIVKQQDSQDLIDKIEQFLQLNWEQKRDMGLAGREKVVREFNREIVVQKYLDEVERILI